MLKATCRKSIRSQKKFYTLTRRIAKNIILNPKKSCVLQSTIHKANLVIEQILGYRNIFIILYFKRLSLIAATAALNTKAFGTGDEDYDK